MSDLSQLHAVVALATDLCGPDGYEGRVDEFDAPELPNHHERPAVALVGLRKLFRNWRLDEHNYGSNHWNPLGQIVPPGSKIVIKPNWVFHMARNGHTIDSLVTHTSVIRALLEYVALTNPASVVIGDAPLQSCDFSALSRQAELYTLLTSSYGNGFPAEIIDFRRTFHPTGQPAGDRIYNARSLDHFVEFDLGTESLLTPLDGGADKFRVTAYDPEIMSVTHRAGHHKYLIAREVLEADIILNVPKLKCHLKAGITGALKNLVGINGHKEYLPHHRKGGSDSGGDCYPGSHRWKTLAENALDAVNRPRNAPALRRGLAAGVSAARKLVSSVGGDDNLEGSWFGNDTVWRMCLDLNRIVLYGTLDGKLAQSPQRQVVSITDAIIAGEGDGPLRPTPVHAGIMTGSLNSAAADYVHARLMGLAPQCIPIVQRAFELQHSSFSLAAFTPSEIRVRTGGPDISGTNVPPIRSFLAPRGWRGHCELHSLTNVSDAHHLANI